MENEREPTEPSDKDISQEQAFASLQAGGVIERGKQSVEDLVMAVSLYAKLIKKGTSHLEACFAVREALEKRHPFKTAFARVMGK